MYFTIYQTIICSIQHFNIFVVPANPPEYGTANCINGTCYFDEMMKAYINIKNNSNLYPHQTLNKRIWLMKRESRRSPTHHFSFGERFDEAMMSGYYVNYQYVKLFNHQFIGFSPLIKSAGEATGGNIATRKRRQTGSPSDRLSGEPTSLAKRKGQPTSAYITTDTVAGFWGTKSHSLLGRFLHAPLMLLLKTSQ